MPLVARDGPVLPSLPCANLVGIKLRTQALLLNQFSREKFPVFPAIFADLEERRMSGGEPSEVSRGTESIKDTVFQRLDQPPSIWGSPHYLEECTKWQIPHSTWTIQGHTIAGERTGFMIPELRLFLDGGMSSCERKFLQGSCN